MTLPIDLSKAAIFECTNTLLTRWHLQNRLATDVGATQERQSVAPVGGAKLYPPIPSAWLRQLREGTARRCLVDVLAVWQVVQATVVAVDLQSPVLCVCWRAQRYDERPCRCRLIAGTRRQNLLWSASVLSPAGARNTACIPQESWQVLRSKLLPSISGGLGTLAIKDKASAICQAPTHRIVRVFVILGIQDLLKSLLTLPHSSQSTGSDPVNRRKAE
mmetsp:Transcript_29444/g.63824  ORF Transcript_29444/g.63824 Transcript_29444/m.63824 type:complete len:218 (-) Transcript_29444:56-709(-)